MIKQNVIINRILRQSRKSFFLAFSMLFFFIVNLNADFTPISIDPPLGGAGYSDLEWGDYDNDGDLDLAFCGYDGTWNQSTRIYRNDGGNHFVDIAGFYGVSDGSVSWGDTDNDGDLDLIVSGNYSLKLYKNDGNDTFSELSSNIFDYYYDYHYSDTCWGDYDNDGDIDLLITGASSSDEYSTRIYRNNGNNNFEHISGAISFGLNSSAAAWGDYDNDGDLDLVNCGYASTGNYHSRLYENNGNGTFTYVDVGADFAGVHRGDVAWGDYDNDGDLDLVISGDWMNAAIYEDRFIANIYRNDNGTFVNIDAGLSGAILSSVSWGDYDNDGDLDLVIQGETYIPEWGWSDYLSRIYKNEGSDTFSHTDLISSYGRAHGSIEWGDYDNDGDLDLVNCGFGYNQPHLSILKNNSITSNTLPQPPSSLTINYNLAETNLEFRWSGGYDIETPVNGLEYEIRVATNPISDNLDKWIISPSTGKGNSPFRGNYLHSFVGSSLLQSGVNIKAGTSAHDKTYYAQVRTIDTAFGKSEWSAVQSYYVDLYTPGTVTNLFAEVGDYDGEIKLSWQMPGDDEWSNPLDEGSKFAVQRSSWEPLLWSTSSVDTIVVSTHGLTPLTTVNYTLTGLESGLTYYLKIWHADETENWSEISNTATAYAKHDTDPPADITELEANQGFYNAEILLSWNSPGDNYWDVPLGYGSQFVIQHSSLSDITWSKEALDNISVSTSGVTPNTDVSYLVTGLMPGTTYYFRIWYADMPQNWSDESNGATTYAKTDTQAPAVVTDLSASISLNDDEIILDWSLPGDDDWDFALFEGSQFRIQHSTWVVEWSTFSAQVIEQVSGKSPLYPMSYTVTGLDSDTTHYFVIWHADSLQHWSFVSSTVSAKTVDLTPPAKVSIVPDQEAVEGEIRFKWNTPGDNSWEKTLEEGSRFAMQESTWTGVGWSTASAQINVSTSGVDPLTVVYYTLTGLDPGDIYYYKIWYMDECSQWAFPSDLFIISVQGDVSPPNAVTNLSSLAGLYEGVADLSWTVPGDDGMSGGFLTFSKFKIQHSTFLTIDPGTSTSIEWSTGLAQVTVSTHGINPYDSASYSLENLPPSATHYIKLWHCDEVQNYSEMSNITTVWLDVDISSPAAVTDFLAVPGDYGNEIKLSWSAPGDNEWVLPLGNDSHFVIQRSTVESVGWSTEALDIVMITDLESITTLHGGSIPIPIENGIQWSTGSLDIFSVSTQGVSPGVQVEYIIDELELNTSHYFRIWHTDKPRNWSDESNGATSYAKVDTTHPGKVYDLTSFTGTNGGEVILNWSTPGNDGTVGTLPEGSNFAIQYSTFPPPAWSTSTAITQVLVSTHGVPPPTSVSYTVTGLPASVTHYFGLWYQDDFNNWALEVSNISTTVAQGITLFDIYVGVIGVEKGDVSWGDYDNDGDLDLAICGDYGSQKTTRIYRNDNTGTFSDISANLIGVNYGSLAWGDYDNDGDLDLVVSGNAQSSRLAKIYSNDNNDVFSDTSAALDAVDYSSLAWGDYDNDGDLDLALCGNDGTSIITKIYENDRYNSFSVINSSITGVNKGSLAWGDYDNDGDLDLLISGEDESSTRITKLYQNTAGSFSDIGAGLKEANNSSLAWGDYDNDGDLDFAICGSTETIGRSTIIYKNNSGTFADVNAGIEGYAFGELAWGDYDSDGDLDLAVSGWVGSGKSAVYRNEGGDAFVEIDVGIPSAYYSSLAWGDYDNDDDLDLFICGFTASQYISKVCQNIGANANSVPSEPSTLNATYNSSTKNLELRWDSVIDADAETPDNGLQYEIRVATNDIDDSLTKWIISPSTGLGSSPFMGNYPHSFVSSSSLQLGINIHYLGLISESTYYWQIRGIDTGFKKSQWSDPQSIYIADVHEPATVTDLFAQTGEIESEIALSWTMPGDEGWEIPLSSGSQFVVQYSTWEGVEWSTSAPTQYSRVVSTSGVTPLTRVNYALTGLVPGITYYSKIWHADEAGNYSDYSNTVSTYSQVDVTPPSAVTNLDVVRGDRRGDVILSWSVPGDDGDYVTLSTGSEFRISYMAGIDGPWSKDEAQIIISTDNLAPGTTVSYEVKELLSSSAYYFKIWHIDESNNCSDNSNSATLQELGFTDIFAGIEEVYQGELVWVDYDSDGDLDISICGSNDAKIYRNDSGVFNEISTNIDGVSRADLDWGDYDNDGDLDLVVCGSMMSKIYRNDGNDSFVNINAGIEGVENGDISWGDYNNDGRLDLAVCGSNKAKIYRNDGNDIFAEIVAGFTGVYQSTLDWGDFDNDGDLDLVICGLNGSSGVTYVYRNDGDNTFTSTNVGIVGVYNGSVSFGDYDNDGYLDLAVTGQTGASSKTSKIYKNNGNGAFSDISAGLISLSNSAISWGDYSNDGYLDLAICGEGSNPYTTIYVYDGFESFYEVYPELPGIKYGSIAWGDYNNDGDLDIALLGIDQYSNPLTRIYHNNEVSLINSSCTAPSSNFSSSYIHSMRQLKISWGNGYDVETSTLGLNYEIRMATNPVIDNPDHWIISPSSGLGISPFVHKYPIRKEQLNYPSLILDSYGLINESTHYWQIRSIDAGFKKSPWSDTQSIYIADVHEPAAVTDLSAETGVIGGEVILSWSMPGDDYEETNPLVSGSEYFIQYSTWSEVTWSTASVGNFVRVSTSGVVPGTVVVYTVAGLTPDVLHYFKIWHVDEVSNWSQASNLISEWSRVDITPPADITDLTAYEGSIEGQIDLSWGMPGDDGLSGTLVAGSSFVVQRSTWPRDVWDYNSTTDTIIISTNGVTPSTTVYYTLAGLDAGATYYIRVWHCDEVSNWSDESNGATIWAQVDVTEPADVTDLLAQNYGIDGEVALYWSVPGDDENSNTLASGSEFLIQYSTWANVVWSTSAVSKTILVSTSGINPHTNVSYMVTDLSNNKLYYFKIWHKDENQNWSHESNSASEWASLDDIQPANISDFSVSSTTYGNQLYLAWSAPGDNNYEYALEDGSEFRIMYSTFNDVFGWSTASAQVRVSTSGVIPGSEVSYYLVTSLEQSVTYYLKIWHADESINWSGMSNLTSYWVQIDTTAPAVVTDLSAEAGPEYGSIKLSWTAVGDNGTELTLGEGSQFAIQHSTYTDGVFWSTASAQIIASTSNVVPGTGVSYTFYGFVYSPVYYFAVWHMDGSENWSVTSGTQVYSSSQRVIFTESLIDVVNVRLGDLAWGDYDNDLDLDLLVTGENGTYGERTILYKNDGIGNLTQVENILHLEDSAVAWGDYNNDGKLDLALCGYNDHGNLRVYENGSGDSFLNYISLSGIYKGKLAWADYDNDGDLDLAACGFNGSSPETKIYTNNGDETFSDSVVSIDGIYDGSLAWADYDNDGDLDFIISGSTSYLTGKMTKLYKNDGSSVFVEVNSGIIGLNNSALDWGDYDNDGDLDLAICGGNTTENITRIYRNDNGTFVDLDDTMQGVFDGSIAWGDCDNDGDLDLAVTGNKSTGSWTGFSAVYINNGDDTFTNGNVGIKNLYYSALTWGDYKNNGKLDLVICGDDGSNYYTKIYENVSSILANNSPSPPSSNFTTTLVVEEEKFELRWDEGSDAETPTDGLRYEIRMATKPLVGDLASWIISTNNVSPVKDKLGIYKVDGDTFGADLAFDISKKTTYYWQVRAIDTMLRWSQWSEQNLIYINDYISPGQVTSLDAQTGTYYEEVDLAWNTPGDDASVNALLPGSRYLIQYSTWGIVQWLPESAQITISTSGVTPGSRVYYTITGLPLSERYYFKIWTVDSANNYSQRSANLSYAKPKIITYSLLSGIQTLGASNGSLAFADCNGDNKADVVINGLELNYSISIGTYVPEIPEIIETYLPTFKIFIMTEDDPIIIQKPALLDSDIEWGDYDNDGDLDLAYCGMLYGVAARVTGIYEYDGIEEFVEKDFGFTGVDNGSLGFGDYDNDGDLDLAICGSDGSSSRITKLYRNDNGQYNFIDMGFIGVENSELKWGDYDNDGDLDLLINGYNGISNIARIYRNDNSSFADMGNSGLVGVINGSLDWGDYNNDGFLDVGICGNDGINRIAKIFKNNSDGTFTDVNSDIQGVDYGSFVWGDYNSDGKLDFAVCGSTESGQYTGVYQNYGNSIFSEIDAEFLDISSGTVAFVDIDNNNTLDLVLCGAYEETFSEYIPGVDTITFTVPVSTYVAYLNEGANTEQIPSEPSVFSSEYDAFEGYLKLHWDDGDGCQGAPVKGLNYEIRVASSPIADNPDEWIVSPGKGLGIISHNGNYTHGFVSSTTLQPGANISHTSLSGYSTYYWQVRTINASLLKSTWSVEQLAYIDDADSPSAVTALTAYTGKIEGEIDLVWNMPGDDENTGTLVSGSGFNIQYSTESSIEWIRSSAQISVSTSGVTPLDSVSYTITGLIPYATYYFSIWHFDEIGNWSSLSNITSNWAQKDVTPPAAANDFSAFPGVNAREINLSWSAPGDDDWSNTLSTGSLYSIQYSTWSGIKWSTNSVQISSYISNVEPQVTLSHVITNLVSGNTHYLKIWHCDEHNNWSEASYVAMTIPKADTTSPQDVTDLFAATGTFGGEIDLNWSVPYNDELNPEFLPGAKFAVQHSSWNGGWSTSTAITQVLVSTHGVSSGTVVMHTVTGLEPGVTKHFRIWYADNVGNWSTNGSNISSSWVKVDISSPASITDFYAQAGTKGGEVLLSWSSPGNDNWTGNLRDGSEFYIQHSTFWNGVVWSTNSEQTIAVSTSGVIPQEYVSCVITDLDVNLTYYFKIRYVDDVNNWSEYWSNTSTAIPKQITFNATTTDIVALSSSSLSWGDYDNDGDLDLAICGDNATENVTRIYRNDGGIFVALEDTMQGVFDGSITWGDYDNDGDLDLAVCGSDTSKIYQNVGGVFTDISAGLTGVNNGSLAWGDYDNDGDLDLAVCGSDTSKVYENDGGVFTDISAGLTGVSNGSLAWGDYDNDGDLDLAICGSDALTVYKNDGGSFSAWEVLTGVSNGSLAWGDYDNDGNLDLAICGSDALTVYKNDGGSFSAWEVLTGVSNGSLAWGDYDNDGDLDLAICGSDTSKVYENNAGVFADISAGSLMGVNNGSLAWGDYDNDKLLDIIVSGSNTTIIYKNYGSNPNTIPNAPMNLTSLFDRDNLKLKLYWDDATDLETTNSNGLYYEVRMSTNHISDSLTNWIISPSTGKGMTPFMGNYLHSFISTSPQAGLFINSTGLVNDTTHYWQARTIDTGFEKSSWTVEQQIFVMDFIPPAKITFISAQAGEVEGELRLVWDIPGDDGWLTVLSTGSQYKIQYSSMTGIVWSTASANITLSTHSASVGSRASCTLTGLDSGKLYYSKIWYADEVQNWSLVSYTGVGSAQVDVTAPSDIIDLIVSSGVLSGQAVLSWSVPGDNGIVDTLVSSSQFKIQHSTYAGVVWSTASSQINVSTSGLSPSTTVSLTIDRLDGDATYYFRIWYSDEVENWSGISNGATSWIELLDTISPAKVTTITGIAGVNEGEVSLSWVVPGDDGWIGINNPPGAQFKILHSTYVSTWNKSFAQITKSTSNVSALTQVSYLVTGLLSGYDYYFKIWHCDEMENWSIGSDTITVRSTEDNLDPSQVTDLAASQGYNAGEILLNWSSSGDNDGSDKPLSSGSEFIIQYTSWGIVDWSSGTYGMVMVSTSGVVPASPVSHVVTGLSFGATYYLRVRCKDESNNYSVWSDTVSTWAQLPDETSPAKITSLIVQEGLRSGYIDLNWQTPGDDGWDLTLSEGSQFKIQHSSDSGIYWSTQTAQVAVSTFGVAPTTSVDYTITGFAAENTYYFKIWYADEAQNWSVTPDTVSTWVLFLDTTSPSSITDFSSSKGDNDGEVDLQWSAPSDDNNRIVPLDFGSEFRIQHSSWPGITWSTESANVIISTYDVTPNELVSLTVTRLIGGLTHYFKLWHRDESYNWTETLAVPSTWLEKYDESEPSSITDLAAYPGFVEGELSLQWSAPGDDGLENALDIGSQFGLQRSTWPEVTWSTGSIDTICVSTYGSVPSTLAKYTLTGLTIGETNYFKIWHADEMGNWSGISNTATGFAQVDVTAPSAVTNLSGVTGSTEGEIVLTWNSPGDDGWSNIIPSGSEFKILYSTYVITWNRVNAQITVSTQNINPHTQVNYTVTGLTFLKEYYFRIWYRDELNNWSNASNLAVAPSSPDTIEPAQVTDLISHRANSSGEILLSWSAPGDDGWDRPLPEGSEFIIQHSSTGVVDWTSVIVSTNSIDPLTQVLYAVTGLEFGATYYLKLQYKDESDNYSLWSDTVSERVLFPDTTAPAAVTTLSASTGLYNGTIELTWNAPGDDGWNNGFNEGEKFIIRHSTLDSGWDKNSAQIEVSTSGTSPLDPISYTVTGLTLGDTYFIGLWYADELNNWSGLSNITSAQAQNDLIPPACVTTITGLTGLNEGEILLSWVVPGDDEWVGINELPGAKFKILHSSYISTWNRNEAQITVSTNGVPPFTQVSYLVTGLSDDKNYYFRVWHCDELQNWSIGSATITVRTQADSTPPADITDLAAYVGSNTGEILLNWSAPGDDGWTKVLSTGSQFKVQHSS
ncbi:FG-GAP-like repeat-containing protein, partial [Elusimicrobiota bacterium]